MNVDVPYTPATTPMAATLMYSRIAKIGSRHLLGYNTKMCGGYKIRKCWGREGKEEEEEKN